MLLVCCKLFADVDLEYRKESDGFEWYQVKTKDFKYGAVDLNNKVIVQPKYDFIIYSTHQVGFEVKDNMYIGFYAPDGTCIIPTSRKYRGKMFKSIMQDDAGRQYTYFEITSPKHTIICDVNGKEILRTFNYDYISPIYTGGCFYYVVQDMFEKYGVLDGNGNLIVPCELCNVILLYRDSLCSRDCFSDEYVSIVPISSITTTSNYLNQ